MEFWDWLEANEDVSRLCGDRGGVMRLGLLHSEWDTDPLSEPNIERGYRGVGGIFILSVQYCTLLDEPSLALDGSELVP